MFDVRVDWPRDERALQTLSNDELVAALRQTRQALAACEDSMVTLRGRAARLAGLLDARAGGSPPDPEGTFT